MSSQPSSLKFDLEIRWNGQRVKTPKVPVFDSKCVKRYWRFSCRILLGLVLAQIDLSTLKLRLKWGQKLTRASSRRCAIRQQKCKSFWIFSYNCISCTTWQNSHVLNLTLKLGQTFKSANMASFAIRCLHLRNVSDFFNVYSADNLQRMAHLKFRRATASLMRIQRVQATIAIVWTYTGNFRNCIYQKTMQNRRTVT